MILLLTIGAGLAMYFYSTRKKAPGAYDTITFHQTADSVLQKVKVFTADDPYEVLYYDSTWTLADSTPLRRIMTNGISDSMTKGYKEKTLYLTYDDRLFYDLEIQKTDTASAYAIDLQFVPSADSMMVYGSINQQNARVINFRNPMTNLYRSFVITYNNRKSDSLKNDTTAESPRTKATKIITVLQP
jgi:hypothetical protein